MILSKCGLSTANHDRERDVYNKSKKVFSQRVQVLAVRQPLVCRGDAAGVDKDYICIMGQQMNANQVSEWREKPPS